MVLRLLLATLAILLAPALLFVPVICLFILAAEYALTGKLSGGRIETKARLPMRTVRETQTKCKGLRAYLVARIESYPAGDWLLGSHLVDEVKRSLEAIGIHTTGEVLAKELRKAQRKGEITKRIRQGTVYVEYTANPPSGKLFDNSTHHGE